MAEASWTYISEEFESVATRLRLDKQKLRDRRRYLVAGTSFSPWCLQVALIIYCISSFDWKLSILWLRSPKRKGKRLEDDVSDEQLLQQLETAFLACDENELMSYVDPSSSTLSKSAIATAMTFTSEFQLAEKTYQMNRDDGKVMTSRLLVSEYNQILDHTCGAGQMRRRNDHRYYSTRNWAVRFRKRLSCKYSKIGYTGRHIPKAEMQEKACLIIPLGSKMFPPSP